MSFFDILGSIFEKWPMTDLTNVIVSMCLVSYKFCMIPHVLTVTFGLNLSGAWGDCIALKGTVKVLFGIIQDIQDLGWATQNDREYKCNVLVHFTHGIRRKMEDVGTSMIYLEGCK